MHTMHLLPGVAIQPNLELKTQPKQLLGSLTLVITLPRCSVDQPLLSSTRLVGFCLEKNASLATFPTDPILGISRQIWGLHKLRTFSQPGLKTRTFD